MSGYAGVDQESEHALILAENGIHASQELLRGPVLSHCLECGEEIPQARREAAQKLGHKCTYCIECQTQFDKPKQPRMLDWIL